MNAQTPRGRWRPVRTADGSWTLAHPVHGETCHSTSGAWTEARERHARPCELHDFAGSELRLLDVGCGLGLSLAAALEALAERGASLAACSLELDPTVLVAALELYDSEELRRGPWEPFHRPVRQAMARALKRPEQAAVEGVEMGQRGRLWLLLGDARERLAGFEAIERFDAVFLDPFSPRREPDLWQPGFLAEIAGRMAPGSLLSTYSAASGVRRALLAAGLRVGRGPRVGRKAEGTLASPDRELAALREERDRGPDQGPGGR
jgi:tRNA U34 5-methylaminomethyl-2-thiouridine-forming methyltransferase MnmC